MDEHLAQALPQHPVAGELAAFEWALAFDAADAPLLQVEDLAAAQAAQYLAAWLTGGLISQLQAG